MQKSIYIFSGITIAMTLIPFIRHEFWVFRAFEFPRLQKAMLVFAALISLFFCAEANCLWLFFFLGTTACYVYLLWLMFPFTPFAPKQVPSAKKGDDTGEEISILEWNVYQYNNGYQLFLKEVAKYQPDVVLMSETDARWANWMEVLKKDYPYHLLKPLENEYGLLLFSKIPFEDAHIEFLIDSEIPSMHLQLIMPSKRRIKLHFLHPAPPSPQEAIYTTERDAELLIIAKKAKGSTLPVIVAGDLNDVAWSYTTDLFQKISGLLDPRRGRGFYNSFHAKIPLIRFPLDHIFCSEHFNLISMKRLPGCGSDHFPIFSVFSLAYHTGDYAESLERPTAEDLALMREKIENGKEEGDVH